jgi:redox-sensing transcriptional repressor
MVIPEPTIARLCSMYRFCEDAGVDAGRQVSSAALGRELGATESSIRKDISFLGETGRSGAGYGLGLLKKKIAAALGLSRRRRTCVVGLGSLGTALLEYERLGPAGFDMVAGFDASINRLETLRTSVKLYPAYEVSDVVRRERIEVGIIAVPAAAAREAADSLAAGGVQAIVNFAPVVVRPPRPGVVVRNVDMLNELRVVAAQSFLSDSAHTPLA